MFERIIHLALRMPSRSRGGEGASSPDLATTTDRRPTPAVVLAAAGAEVEPTAGSSSCSARASTRPRSRFSSVATLTNRRRASGGHVMRSEYENFEGDPDGI